MKFIQYKIALLATALLVSVSSLAAEHNHKSPAAKMAENEIMIHNPWSRALPPVATNGAAYLMVHNNSQTSDTIVAVKSPIAASVMMHKSISDNGNVRMEHVSSLSVKPRGMVNFKPGGYHVMLMGLKKPLVAGESFPITIVMEKAGEITSNVVIKSTNGKQKTMPHHNH